MDRSLERGRNLVPRHGEPTSLLTRRNLPEAPWLGMAMALLAALPFLVVRAPQLTDYPSHLARYYVMLHIADDAWLQHYYEFNWLFTGNIGVDVLMVPLGRLLGVETAGWLVGMVIPPLTGLALVCVEWTLRRRVGVGALLAMTTIWSPALGLGFYNFCLALALALFAFALWVRLEGWRWRWAPFLAIGMLVWLCHASGWGVLGVLVFGYEWSRRKSWRSAAAIWPLLLPFVPLLLLPGPPVGRALYGAHYWVYKIAIIQQAMRDQSWSLDWLTPQLLAVAVVVALVLRRIDGRVGWAALGLTLLVFAVPRHLGGGDYADYRLVAVALMLGCLAIDWQAPRWVVWLAPALFLVRLDFTTRAWHANSQVLEADLKALDYLPQGARVAGAVLVDRRWPLNPFEHAPSYATVRRDALVNSHFAIPGVHMLRLRQPDPDFIDPSQRVIAKPSRPVRLDLFAPATRADWLWYFGSRRPDTMPEGSTIVFRTSHSFLARLAKRRIGG